MPRVDLERTFDLAVHMHENPKQPYVFDSKKNIKLNYKQQGQVLHAAIQAFFQSSACMHNDKIIQAFSGSADLPVLTKDVFNVVQAEAAYDTAWQQAFKPVKLKKGQLNWEIADVASGLTFSLVPEGGKAKIFGFTGTKVTVNIEKYGAGLGVTWEMVEGRRLYQFIDQMMVVKAALNTLWADIHYGLLGTAGASNTVAYDTTGTTVTQKDVNTINAAYLDIATACKAKGYGDMATAPMIMYYAPALKARIMQAFNATNVANITSGIAASHGQVSWNITPIPTWNAGVLANKALMVLPGNKIQNSLYLQELGLAERDIETLSDLKTYWTAFGATVADGDQVVQLSFT